MWFIGPAMADNPDNGSNVISSIRDSIPDNSDINVICSPLTQYDIYYTGRSLDFWPVSCPLILNVV